LVKSETQNIKAETNLLDII